MKILHTREEIKQAINNNQAEFRIAEDICKKVNLILPIKNMGFLNLAMLKFCCFLLPFDGCSGCHCVDKLKSRQICENQTDKMFWFKKDMLFAIEFFGYKTAKAMVKNYDIKQDKDELIFVLIKR